MEQYLGPIQKIIIETEAPPRGIDLGRAITSEEITAIYKECANERAVPEWIVEEGIKNGWRPVSIDAWSE